MLQFPALQSLVLTDNRLTDIKALGSLRHLTHVDVSGNKLTQVGCQTGGVSHFSTAGSQAQGQMAGVGGRSAPCTQFMGPHGISL